MHEEPSGDLEGKDGFRARWRQWVWGRRARRALRSGVVKAWNVALKEPHSLAWAVLAEKEAIAQAWMNDRATQTALWLHREKKDARAFFNLAQISGHARFETGLAANKALAALFQDGTHAQRAMLARAAWLKTPRVLREPWGGVRAMDPHAKDLDWREGVEPEALTLRELTWKQALEDGQGIDWERHPHLVCVLSGLARSSVSAQSGHDVFALSNQIGEFLAHAWSDRSLRPRASLPGEDRLEKPQAPRAAEAEASAMELVRSVGRWFAAERKEELGCRLLCSLRFIAESNHATAPRGSLGLREVESDKILSFAHAATTAVFAQADNDTSRERLIQGWKTHQREFLWNVGAPVKAGQDSPDEASMRFLWESAKAAWGVEEAADLWARIGSGSHMIDALVESESLRATVERAQAKSREERAAKNHCMAGAEAEPPPLASAPLSSGAIETEAASAPPAIKENARAALLDAESPATIATQTPATMPEPVAPPSPRKTRRL